MKKKNNILLTFIKSISWGYVLIFAILTLIGVLSFCFNDMLKWVVVAAGIVISLFGISYGTATLIRKQRGAGFAVKIVIAVAALISGVMTIIFASHGIEVLTSVLGTMFIIDGAFKLQSSAKSREYRSCTWWVLLVPALLSVCGGFALIKFGIVEDDRSMTFVAILLGVTSVIDAISNLLAAIFGAIKEKDKKSNETDALEPEKEPVEETSAPLDEENAATVITSDDATEVAGSNTPTSDTLKKNDEGVPETDTTAKDTCEGEDAGKTECGNTPEGEDASAESDKDAKSTSQNQNPEEFEISVPMIEIPDNK